MIFQTLFFTAQVKRHICHGCYFVSCGLTRIHLQLGSPLSGHLRQSVHKWHFLNELVFGVWCHKNFKIYA